MLSADLVLKGLGGLAVVGGATTVGVCYQQEKWIFAKKKVETLTLEELAGKVGLDCKKTGSTEPTATAGVECGKKEGANLKISVKKDSNPFELSDLPTNSGGKIKVYKTSEGEKHNNDFKFVIEEGDIGSDSNKLEEFETYEIKKEGDKYHLTKKTSINEGIKKALGLPENCNLPTTTTAATDCDISGDKFKKINFDGGNEERGEGPTGAKLKISKVEGEDYGNKYKFKFVLESAQDAKISKTVTIKKGTNTEFKIKVSTSGSPKTLTLEKAWTLTTLGAKVGLKDCTNGNPTPKECSFESAKVNLYNDSTNNAKGASLSSTDASKKIKVEEEQPGYSQGFKFYVENADITLQNGGTDKKIHKKDTSTNLPTYEIKQQTVGQGGTKDWYLSKVTTAPVT